MNFKQVRRRCEERLATLDIPMPFDARAFCEVVARQRGRPIRLLPYVFPRGQYGFVFRQPNAEVIYYEQQTSPLHQEHIILHELAHLLCGHTGRAELGDEHTRRLFPTLGPGLISRVLGRGGYSSEEEREAEILATMILRAAGRHRRTGRVPDPVSAENLRRLESGM